MNPVPQPSDAPCCSDLDLDQLMLGELDEDAATRLRAHVATSPRCQARLAALERVQQAWAERAPPFAPPVAPSVALPADTSPPAPGGNVVALDAARARRRRLGTQTMAGLAAAAAVLIVVRAAGPDDAVRTKGPGLAVTLTQAAGQTRSHTPVDVFAGDAVATDLPVIARTQASPGAALAVVVEGRVVTRGVADAAGVATLSFNVARAGDVVVAACPAPLPDVVVDRDLSGCSVDTFALSVRP